MWFCLVSAFSDVVEKQGLLAPRCFVRAAQKQICRGVIVLQTSLAVSLRFPVLFVSAWKAHCLCRVHLGNGRPLHTAQAGYPSEPATPCGYRAFYFPAPLCSHKPRHSIVWSRTPPFSPRAPFILPFHRVYCCFMIKMLTLTETPPSLSWGCFCENHIYHDNSRFGFIVQLVLVLSYI